MFMSSLDMLAIPTAESNPSKRVAGVAYSDVKEIPEGEPICSGEMNLELVLDSLYDEFHSP